MKKFIVAGVASVAMLGLAGCTSAGPTIEFGEASPTPTPTPTPSETFTPESNLSDIERGVDEVHILTGGKYGSGSTYSDVAELLQVICWTLDDARSVDDAMDIIFDAGDDSGVSTKHSAAFIYSATKNVCPEWQVAVQKWSNS